MTQPSISELTILSDIGAHTEICDQIGRFVAAYASMEMGLWKLYAKILGHKDEAETMELLGSIQSFVHRADAIARFIDMREPPEKVGYLAVLNSARDINAFRVSLMHGAYCESEDRALWLVTGLSDPKRNYSAKSLTGAKIEERVTACLSLVQKIKADFFPHEPHVTFRNKSV